MYYIVVTWTDGDKEIIDEAESKDEAQYLRSEYRLAYNRESYKNLVARPEKSLQRTSQGCDLIAEWEE